MVRRLFVVGMMVVLIGGWWSGAEASVKINELLYEPGQIGRRSDLHEHEWVEIYNAGASSVDLTGWTISNRDGGTEIGLPPWDLPPGCFLTVHQADGIDDSDFDDLDGHHYTGDSTAVFDDDEDECALYSGFPDETTIEDFVCWSNKGVFTPGTAHGYAVSAGIWISGDYYDSEGLGSADCLARYFDGYDRDVPDDWRTISWALYVHNAPLQPENPLQELPRNRAVIDDATPTFDWIDFADADSWQLQVDNDWDFSSPEIDVSGLLVSEHTAETPLSDDAYFHRVRAVVGGQPTPWAAEWLVVIQTSTLKQRGPGLERSCPHKWQHKDTNLLCIWTDVNGAHTRPGCPESGNYGWDKPHPDAAPPAPGVQRVHGTMYCWAASIAMVNAKYGGDLNQDRIAYQNWRTTRPDPEGDLGHDRGASDPQVTGVLSWALSGAAITYVPRPAAGFTFAQMQWWINQLDCFVAGTPGHCLVPVGYTQLTSSGGTNIQVVYANDPWLGPSHPHVFSYVIEGAPQRYFRRHRTNVFDAVWLQPAAGVEAQMQEASVWIDSDTDGVMYFDETNRFHTDDSDTDTDGDDVADKQDIRSYTFHDTDHAGHENNALNFPDIDGDGRRAELDCDTDNDSDFDGGEDIDGDGKSPEAGETCVFAHDFELWVDTDKDFYEPFEPVYFYGGTFHRNATYPYSVVRGCPVSTWPDGTPYLPRGQLQTDGSGYIIAESAWYFPPGCYDVVVDVLRDNLYSCPDNWDPYATFWVLCPGSSSMICSIQCGDIPLYTEVFIDSVVVTAVDLKPATYGFWVQEPEPPEEYPNGEYSGILVYMEFARPDTIGGGGVSLGDLVSVRGRYEEDSLEGPSVSRISHPDDLDAPEVHILVHDYGMPDAVELTVHDLGTAAAVSFLCEKWEGVWCRVDTVVCTEWLEPIDDHEWQVVEVEDFTGFKTGDSLRVDDKLVSPTLAKPNAGDTLTTVYGIFSYEDWNYKLLPRSNDDVVPLGLPAGPNLLQTYSRTNTQAVAVFDRAVDAETAEDVDNYFFSSGTVLITACVRFPAYHNKVLITHTPPTPGMLDELYVCDVENEFGVPMLQCQTAELRIGVVPVSFVQTPKADGDTSQCYGDQVSVSGIVTGGSDQFIGFYLGTPGGGPYSGIYVFDTEHHVDVGDSVIASAVVDENDGMTELSVPEYVNGSIFTMTPPLEADVLDPWIFSSSSRSDTAEAWEGCLVELEYMAVATFPDEGGEWDIHRDVDTVHVGASGDYTYEPDWCDSVHVTGLVDWKNGLWTLQPRDEDDIEVYSICTAVGGEGLPLRVVEIRNYPNPFNPTTVIEFGVASPTQVKLTVFDINGRLVRILLHKPEMARGNYRVEWNGNDAEGHPTAAGIYFCRLEAGDRLEVRKLVLVK